MTTGYVFPPYVKRIVLRNMPAVEQWHAIARAAFGGEYDDSLLQRAANRVAHGDVRETRYGHRVQVRPDLDDDRSASGAEAYWPDRDGGCLCYAAKARGACSHAVAIELLHVDLDDVIDAIDLSDTEAAREHYARHLKWTEVRRRHVEQQTERTQ